MNTRSKIRVARSLFISRSILELPNELVSLILTYFSAKELMLLRCVSQSFVDIIDNNKSIWSKASYQNLWPNTDADREVFRRGADADNKECLVKLGLAHLYHYNLIAEAEKTREEVLKNASFAAQYFSQLDKINSPLKPLTWMLIRPPWGSTMKSLCLKQSAHHKLTESQFSLPEACVLYNVGRVIHIESGNDLNAFHGFVHDSLTNSSKLGCSHAMFENLLHQKAVVSIDPGLKLQWLRELHECALSGNLDASFEIAHYFVANKSHNFVTCFKASQFCRTLFQRCRCLRKDKLELFQPKINSLMRTILVDWLAEVAYMKNMSHQVLHAAVYYIDRFLLSQVVERTKLQLVGITCLLLAAKSHYDSRLIHILTVRESSWLTDQTYQYEDVVKMMGEIIGLFKGDLWNPTSWSYLYLMLSFTETEADTKDLAYYLHDLSLQFTCFGVYKPSLLACSIIFLVHILLNKDVLWLDTYVEYTGFSIADLSNCAALLYFKCFVCPSIKDDRDLTLKTIKEHYSSEKYSFISNKVDILSPLEIKSRILMADASLSCVSHDPYQFVVVDDTLDVSIKSVDYDGDCEDHNDFAIDSSSDEESFYVGRSRISSHRSIDDLSDDETRMDTESFHLAYLKWECSQRDTFTPIFNSSGNPQAMNMIINAADHKNTNENKVLFTDEACSSLPTVTRPHAIHRKVKRKHLKRKCCAKNVVIGGKRTRIEPYK